MPRNDSRNWLVVLFVVAFAIRMAFCEAKTGLGHALESGYLEYVTLGERLVQHGTLVSTLMPADTDPVPSALFPPAYAALVAAVYTVLGVKTFAAALTLQIINALATSLSVVFVFLVARRLGGEAPAWIAGVLAALNPTLFGYTHLIWDTSLFTLGVIVTVWFACRLSSQRGVGLHWLGYGLWLGGLALLNPALTVAYPLLVLWPLSKSQAWRIGPIVRGTALSLTGWMIVIMPWTVRNYHHFGELIYVRDGFMHELWMGVCPQADTDRTAVFNDQYALNNDGLRREVASMGERAYFDACGRRALQAISGDPWRFARLVGLRFVDYWMGTVFTHSPPGAGGWPQSAGRAAVAMFMIGEVVVLVVCLGLRRKISTDLRWLLATVVSFSVVYCLTHVQIRFRAPAEPIMAIILAVLATDTYRTLSSHGSRPARARQGSDRSK